MTDETKAKVRPAKGGTAAETPSKPRRRIADAALELQEVYCQRLHRNLPVFEHKACPYCFGEESDIRTGDHKKFCDYEEGKDPVSFGFPES